MTWQDDYKKKLVAAEEAIKIVKPGDYVAFGYGAEPFAMGSALLARGKEVGGIKVFLPAPGRQFAWYDPGHEDMFQVEVAHILPVAQEMIRDKRGDFLIGSLLWAHDTDDRNQADVLLTQLSSPDETWLLQFWFCIVGQEAGVKGRQDSHSRGKQ